MLAVREGDLAKLGLLFERYHLVLFDFLSRMTGNSTTAEDLVQDIFVRMLKYPAATALAIQFLDRIAGTGESSTERLGPSGEQGYVAARPTLEPPRPKTH
jgi:hypothetical protein